MLVCHQHALLLEQGRDPRCGVSVKAKDAMAIRDCVICISVCIGKKTRPRKVMWCRSVLVFGSAVVN